MLHETLSILAITLHMRRAANRWRDRLAFSRTMRAAGNAAIALLLVSPAPAHAASACVAAGLAAEAGTTLPHNLLIAVGRVESGRWDPGSHRVQPWPWAIDVAGQPRFFADKSAAVAATRALLRSGRRNIDVGCFQISLLYHPLAFASLDQAFDPVANARYAAGLLLRLHGRYGSWADAVAAYHSTDPTLGTSYRRSVFAAWHPDAPGAVVQLASAVPSVHVWAPGLPGAMPRIIYVGGPSRHAGNLPRIITPVANRQGDAKLP